MSNTIESSLHPALATLLAAHAHPFGSTNLAVDEANFKKHLQSCLTSLQTNAKPDRSSCEAERTSTMLGALAAQPLELQIRRAAHEANLQFLNYVSLVCLLEKRGEGKKI